jgi:hypothetical protein
VPDESEAPELTDLRATAGLCGQCRHAIVRPTKRGTVYLRCALAAVDDRFAKYPRLPVVRCAGYEPDPEVS